MKAPRQDSGGTLCCTASSKGQEQKIFGKNGFQQRNEQEIKKRLSFCLLFLGCLLFWDIGYVTKFSTKTERGSNFGRYVKTVLIFFSFSY